MLLLCACAEEAPQSDQPVAAQHPVSLSLHGETRVDAYHYLSRPDHPDTQAYIESERSYLADKTAAWEPLQRRYLREINRVLPNRVRSTPVFIEGYAYRREILPGTQYPRFLRTHVSNEETEIILDLNDFDRGGGYLRTGAFDIHQDLVAFTIDDNGDERYRLKLMNFRSKVVTQDGVTGVRRDPLDIGEAGPHVTWTEAGDALLYLTADRAAVMRFDVTTGEREEIYREQDPAFQLGLRRDGRYRLLNAESPAGNELLLMGPDDKGFDVVAPRSEGVIYRARVIDEVMAVLTNQLRPDFDLAIVELESAGERWHYLDRPSSGVIRDFEPLSSQAFAIRLSEGLDESVVRLAVDEEQQLVFSSEAGVVQLARGDFGEIRFEFTSPVTQPVRYRWDNGELTQESSADNERYAVSRRWVSLTDHQVPVTFISPRNLNRPSPLLLTVYGAYGVAAPMGYDPTLLPYLEAGFQIGIVHVRGGGELGERWRDDGRLLNKGNGFSDFLDVAQSLAEAPDIDAQYLFARGRSAGATLVAGAVNERPALFRGVILEVPFVDVITTLSARSDALAEADLLEWGDPRDETYYRVMQAYSPYDRITAQDYPGMLVRVDLNDQRVGYHEGLKWLARVRALATDSSLKLIDITDETGHLGPTDQFERRRQESLDYAFIMSLLEE